MNPIASALLSFLLNGLGQIYNGEVKKGIIFIVASFIFTVGFVVGIVLLFESFILSLRSGLDVSRIMRGAVLFTVSGFILCLIGLLSIIDAYKTAKRNADKS